MTRLFFILCQWLAICLLAVVDLFTRSKVTKPKDFVVPKGTLIMANHQSVLDPWLITYHLGFSNVARGMPFRFPVLHRFYRIPVLQQILWSVGAYDMGKDRLEMSKKLLYTRELLRSGQTVMLFPEGKISTVSEIAEFKRGMTMLVYEDFPILLVKLGGMRNFDFSFEFSEVIRSMPAEEKISRILSFFGKA